MSELSMATHALLRQAAAHYRGALQSSAEAKCYLKGRGISPETAFRFGLGFARDAWESLGGVLNGFSCDVQHASGLLASTGEGASRKYFDRFRGRLMFPIRDRAGNVAGFGGRLFDGQAPKYLNSPDGPTFKKHELLYGIFEAQKSICSARSALVVEGFVDVLTLAQGGFSTAVATLGTACSAKQVSLLLEMASEVVFCFDGDAAGQQAAERALATVLPFAGQGRCFRFVTLPAGSDPDSFVRERGLGEFRQLVDAAMPLEVLVLQHAMKGCDLDIAEGRALCAHRCKDYWLQLAAGELRDQLVSFCSNVLRCSELEVLTIWSSKEAANV